LVRQRIKSGNKHLFQRAVTFIGEEEPPVETPEPGVLSVVITGLVGAGIMARRRRKRSGQ